MNQDACGDAYKIQSELYGNIKRIYGFDIFVTYLEINCEAPKEIAEEITTVLYNCMVKAGAYFCTRCKLDAEVSRLKDGTLPTYWVH